MSDNLLIAAEPRNVVGKKVKQLRREGVIPAIIYGQSDPINIQFNKLELRRVLRKAGTTHLIDIEVEGKKRTVLAREIQQHVTRGDIIHVDFMEVNMNVAITAEAALVLVGESAPTADGKGSDVLPTHSVEIECLPDDLISEIEVDASKIDSPDTILYVSDLVVPKGVTILTDPETVVARFQYTAVAATEEEEIEEVDVSAVEVIGEDESEE